MHLLQIGNVGDLCGGTAACAWTITRAFPEWRHSLSFRSPPTPETRAAFRGCELLPAAMISAAEIDRIRPDLLLLHNVPASKFRTPPEAPLSIQYLHSRIAFARADVVVACSRWLADLYPVGSVDGVLHQPVPETLPDAEGDTRPLRDGMIVGRLCTPTERKWTPEIVPLYRRLSARHRTIEWEFVGCPAPLVAPLSAACGGRATFHPSGANARRHLSRWDALLYHNPTLTESFGRTAAEAMRAGCVPIVDDRGGFREQITPATGFLCRSADDFAAALSALGSPGRRRQMSRAARCHADRRWSGAAFADRFLRLLRAVVED